MGVKVLMALGYYEVGGFTTVVNNLARYLGKYGVEVTVAARVVRINPPNYLNLIQLNPDNFAAEAKHYDIVHIHTSYPYTKVAVEQGVRNLVFTWHGYTPTIYVPGIRNKAINLALKYAYRRYLPKIKHITAISQYGARQLKKMYHVESRVIPNGVDLDVFKPCKREEQERGHYPVIINVTAYNNLKGKDLLLKYFKTILKQYPKALLIAIGSKAKEKNIIDPGFLPGEELSRYYCTAHLYLLTSRSESFGLPIIESMATGTPVVALDRDDARREHIINSGAGELFRDEQTLIQAVEKILNDWNSYSEKAIQYAKRFNWDDIAREYLKLYNAILTSVHSSPQGTVERT